MAYFRIEYYSHALRRETGFEMLIPNDLRPGALPDRPRRARTLFLLHGYTGRPGLWVPVEVAQRYNLAIVMPTGENAFYLDGLSTGHAYETMLAVELVDYVRDTFRLALTREETAIAGLSMGGFGALHTALAHPDRFGAAAGLSSALIIHDIEGMKPGQRNEMCNYEYYRECFGDLDRLAHSHANPEELVRKLKAAGAALPRLYMACGTEDFLIENNRAFHRFLDGEAVPHEYVEGPGVHDMAFWSDYIVRAIRWMYGE